MSLQRNNHRSDDEQLLFAIWQELSKLDTNISGGFQGNGGWTDDGTTVRLTTSTDNVGIGINTASAKVQILNDDTDLVTFAAMNSAEAGLFVTADKIGINTSEPTYNLHSIGTALLYDEISSTDKHSNLNLSSTSILIRHVDGDPANPTVRRGGIDNLDNSIKIYRGANTGAADNKTMIEVDEDVTFTYNAVPLLTVNSDGLIEVGATASNSSRVRLFEDTDNGTNSVTITVPASITTTKTIVLGGYESTNLAIYETSALSGVAIGRNVGNATMSGNSNIIIGGQAGTSLTSGHHNVIVGDFAGQTITDGTYNTIIGNGAESGASTSKSISIGYNAVTTANNQLVIGSNSGEITTAYIGSGATDGSPKSVTLNATGGSGTNAAGANFSLAGGTATGSGIPGKVKIQTSVPGSSGTTAQTLADREIFVGNYTTLTESSATAVGFVSVPVGTVTGGTILVTVEANDGTDYQCRTLSFEYAAVNKASTTTIGLSTPTEAVAVSTGTLTAAITTVNAGNGFSFYVNAVSSLTQTTLRASFQAKKNFGTGTIS